MPQHWVLGGRRGRGRQQVAKILFWRCFLNVFISWTYFYCQPHAQTIGMSSLSGDISFFADKQKTKWSRGSLHSSNVPHRVPNIHCPSWRSCLWASCSLMYCGRCQNRHKLVEDAQKMCGRRVEDVQDCHKLVEEAEDLRSKRQKI